MNEAFPPLPGEAQDPQPAPQPGDPAVGPERPAPKADRYESAEGDTCCILGASDSGKTFLLAAIHQACMLSGEDGYRLSFAITDEDPKKKYKTSDLMRAAVDCIIRGDRSKLKATSEWTDYSFHVSCRAPLWREPLWWRRPPSINFRFVDGPGEAIFPTKPILETNEPTLKARSRIIDDLRRAKYLIVCVDALKPHLDTFQAGYAGIVGSAAEPTAPYRLRAKRAILLLTKIDEVANSFCAASHRLYDSVTSTGSQHWPGSAPSTMLEYMRRSPRATPRKVAEIIDPIEQARTVLSQQTVSTVRRLLKDNADMAVGVCSSTGFHPDGYPFWSDDPTLRGGLRLMKGQTKDDAYRNWVPFGVKEAILYLLTGRTAPSLRNYSVDNDAKSSARQMFPIPLMHDEPVGYTD